MNNIFNWYSFEPIDTLFFRSSEPMVMGESHDSNFNFPPPIQTIAGAIRTYFYKIDRDDYKDLIKIGEEKGDFELLGPFFEENGIIYIPAPYSWYIDEEEKLVKAEIIESPIIKSSSKELPWAKGFGNLKPLGGRWMPYDDLDKDKQDRIKDIDYFFTTELRTGIALKNKVVREHHIYSFNHCRLKKGIKIIFGINIDEMGDEGVLVLGAEQRFGMFKKEKFSIDLNRTGTKYMSLSLIEGNNATNSSLLSTGKIQYLGGWDLHKGFHKDMKGYFPAGTVFNKKFSNCIAIA